jgi:hypothetical protein
LFQGGYTISSESVNGNRPARAAALASLLSIASVIALFVPGHASAGELVFKGCVSDDGTPRISGKKVCTAIGKGAFFPLTSMTLSPDGRSLYAGTGVECLGNLDFRCYITAAIDRFQRDPKTGALDYRNCLTGDTEQRRTCAELPTARKRAFRAPLGDVTSMAVSPEGDSLYTASAEVTCYYNENEDRRDCLGGNALARFDRDAGSGVVTYQDCITGDRRSGPSGSGACSEIPTATDQGYGSGIVPLGSIAISDDGRSLYATGGVYYGGNSIARFDRDPQTGALTYRGCITGDQSLGPSGSGACTEIPTATQDGRGSGLEELGDVALSDDGTSLYGVASEDVVRFDRDPDTGALTYRGCVTGDKRLGPSGSGACSEIPSATTRHVRRSGLAGPLSLVVSTNGKSLYVGAAYSDAIARFDRKPATGAIKFAGCLTGYTKVGACHQIRSATVGGFDSGFPSPYYMALGDRGRSLFVADDEAVARIRLKRATGSLHYAGCLTGQKGLEHCRETRTAARYRSSGLGGIVALAATGKNVYAEAADDQDIATLAIAPQTKIAKAKTSGHGAAIRFKASSASKFKCKLSGDGVPKRLHHWRRCGSHGFQRKGKEVYRGLGPGKKTFRVRATDRAHTTDPTPAKARWQVG